MKKLFISQIALVGIIAAFSCTKEKIITYTGPEVVEFAPVSRNVYSANAPFQDSTKIQLISKAVAKDSKLTYSVDATSTVLAADYLLGGTAGETVLPADSNFAYIKYTLNPSAAASPNKKLILKLTGGDLAPSENYKLHTLTVLPTPVIFTPNTKTIEFKGGTTVKRDTVRIRLNNAAARFNQPLQIAYTVRAASTAVEGTDYSFVSTKGVATVPARSADGLVILDINPVTADKTLVLEVSTVAGFSLTAATRIITYTIKP